MKKILFLALVLVVAVGMTAAAADVSFSGEVAADVQDMGDDQYQELTGEVQLNISADEFTSAVIRANLDDTEGSIGYRGLTVDRAHITSDLGGWIGSVTGEELPVGIHYNVGWNEFTYEGIDAGTAYEFEGIQAADFTDLGQQFTFKIMDMGQVYASHAFGEDGDSIPAGTVLGGDFSIPVEGVGDLGLELVYSIVPDGDAEKEFGDGHFGAAVTFGMDEIIPDLSGVFGASITADLYDGDQPLSAAATDNDTEMRWGVGGSLTWAELVSPSFSLYGVTGSEVESEEALSALGLGLGVTPIEFLSLDLGLGMDLRDDLLGADVDLMNSADMSVTFAPGAASFTLGYFWVAEDAPFGAVGSINAVNDGIVDDGQLYFSAALEY